MEPRGSKYCGCDTDAEMQSLYGHLNVSARAPGSHERDGDAEDYLVIGLNVHENRKKFSLLANYFPQATARMFPIIIVKMKL